MTSDPTPNACCVAEGFSHYVFDSCLSNIDMGEWLFWLQIRSAHQKNGGRIPIQDAVYSEIQKAHTKSGSDPDF